MLYTFYVLVYCSFIMYENNDDADDDLQCSEDKLNDIQRNLEDRQ